MAPTIYLIRHAKAGHRNRWEGSDEVRPLTRSGWRQAEALVGVLEDAPLRRLVSSPYVRCRQTLEPLARERGLPVEDAGELEEGVGVAETFGLISAIAKDGDSVALSTHGDIMENVLDRLGARGVRLEGPVALEKGSTWVLDTSDGEVTAARYIPPPQ